MVHLKNLIGYCEAGQVFLFPIAWVNLGWSHFLLGELNMAREYIHKALKTRGEENVQIDLGLFYWILGMVHLESGELENARHHANEAIKKSQKARQKWIEGLAWILMGRISGKADQPQIEKAEECILQGMKILQELEIKALYATGYFHLGELYSDAGKPEAALVKLRKAETLFQEMGMDYWRVKTKEILQSWQP